MVRRLKPPQGLRRPSEAGPPAEALGRLDSRQKMMFAAAIAAIVAILVGAALWGPSTATSRCCSQIFPEKDGGAIIAALEQQNIPHRMSDSGAVLGPFRQGAEVRLKLASQGLPRAAWSASS